MCSPKDPAYQPIIASAVRSEEVLGLTGIVDWRRYLSDLCPLQDRPLPYTNCLYVYSAGRITDKYILYYTGLGSYVIKSTASAIHRLTPGASYLALVKPPVTFVCAQILQLGVCGNSARGS